MKALHFSQRTNGVQSTTRGPTVGVPDTPGPAHEEDNACLNSVPLEAFQNRVGREVGHIYIYIYSVLDPMNSNKRFWGAVQKGDLEKGRPCVYIYIYNVPAHL